MLKPTQQFVLLVLFWLVLAIVACVWSWMIKPWLAVGGFIFLLALLDAAIAFFSPKLLLERKLPGRFALGEEDSVKITLRNRGKRLLRFQMFDGIPENAEAQELPYSGKIRTGQKLEISYPVRMLKRGDEVFSSTHLLVTSPFLLWDRRLRMGETEEVKVYPNYEPLVEYALLATEQRIEQMGIIRKNRAGLSKEFHQLRDYHKGDSLNQIDWKSSARRQQLISRDYQEQRDQTVILAVDSGRRMRALDGELSQFDHCLNSMLLLAYIALRQGDKVGVLKFGGKRQRWLPPVKGSHQMPVLLNHLYDYDVNVQPSDFRAAAEQIMLRQKRRALVIVLTNLRGEDGDDLKDALKQLRRRHLVVLASLREEAIDEIKATGTISGLDEALNVAAAQMYSEERKTVLAQLGQIGIQTIDETAKNLPIALCNRYLDIKSEL